MLPNSWDGIKFCVARALYDNVAESPDELAFSKGDCLTVLEQNTTGLEGWWLCSLRGRQGVCPANRLRLVPGLYDLPGKGITHLGFPNKVDPSVPAEQNTLEYDYPPSPVCVQNDDSVCYDVPRSIKPQEQFNYDLPRPYRAEETYDVPKHSILREAAAETYDIPQSHISITDVSKPKNCRLSSGSSALSPSSSTSSLSLSSAEPNYDTPRPVRPSKSIDLTPLGNALPQVTLELDAALERNDKLKEEVLSAANQLLSIGYSQPSSELRVAAVRIRDALTEYTNFSRATLINASASSDATLAHKMNRQLRPLLDAYSIISKTVSVFDKGQESSLTIDQLLACTRHIPEDLRQVASFIQGNSVLLFQKVDGQTVIDDYDYVGIETESLSANDKQLLNHYSEEAEHEYNNFNAVMENFFVSVKNNQPPRVFVEVGKSVLVSVSRLVYLGDTVHRNIAQAKLKNTIGKLSDNLNGAMKSAIQATKEAGTHFPHVQAVQQMVDSMVEVSNCVRELKLQLTVQ